MVGRDTAPFSRRHWLAACGGLLGAPLLPGCAAVEDRPAPTALLGGNIQPGGGGAPAAGTPLLTPWLAVNGAWRGTLGLPGGALAAPAAPMARLQLQQPVGVAARDERVVLYDAGLRQLLRWDRLLDQITPLTAAGSVGAPLGAEHAMGLQLLSDGSLWVAEALAGQVLNIDLQGRVRRTLRDTGPGLRPVAVLQWPGSQDVYVGDATEARILVFNSFGRVQARLGDGLLQSVSAMATGPQGLVVLDRLAQQVLVFDRDGRVLQTFGDDSLLQPRALAVDGHGRVYVGDDSDQRIKAFARDGERLGQVGGSGNGPGRFGRIDALSADGAQLYVADSVNSRVAVLLIAPPSLRGGR
jgi:hypothetical protein